jgi:hypothetical protein
MSLHIRLASLLLNELLRFANGNNVDNSVIVHNNPPLQRSHRIDGKNQTNEDLYLTQSGLYAR